MSNIICNHTSVGMLVNKDGKTLLIERKKFPYGFAPPAGHVEQGETYETAAIRELCEEVGLVALELKLVLNESFNNRCSRQDGTWHNWKVYITQSSGVETPNKGETKQLVWATQEKLNALAMKTRQYISGNIPEDAWQKSPGLEIVWYDLLKQLKRLN